ncbi:MAG: transcriptional regulator [Betaproteobacteria bacterium]|nr:transcriptional regulator [Betaproteobacteria bacterium]
MDDDLNIARIARLLADPARARILRILIDGTMRPAGELAYTANVSAQSASAHLTKLVDGGLLSTEAQGRHRYFRLANAQVADAIESLGSLSMALRPRAPRSPLPSKSVPIQFLNARTCYDHLAGEMAVQVCEAMLKAQWLVHEGRDFRVTRFGEKALAALDIDLEAAQRSRRVFARACVDLTQRRPHVGGALGAALLDLYLRRGWILRARRTRVVTITPTGQQAFRRTFATP